MTPDGTPRNMSLLVTGSIGIDTVTSPYGRVEGALGGSAVYFSYMASFFVPVRLVGVVGGDFPHHYREMLTRRPIDLRGLEVRKESQTFRWTGRFQGAMAEAETVEVDLNVLAERGPRVPSEFADSEFIFLANTHPTLQRELLAQVKSPRLVVCDTMDLWIKTERESLLKTLELVTGVIVNDVEARMLTGKMNLIEAGEEILQYGPRFVIVKKGEHGAVMVTPDHAATVPAYPVKTVHDPTGAGDTFAGGVLGHLATEGKTDLATLRQALVRGTVAASFTVEDFSLRRLERLTGEEIQRRVEEYVEMLRFD